MVDLVSIGVPVYRGAEFLPDALRSIRDQSHRELDVLISVDGADEASAAVCEPFLRDSRFRIIVQQRQLGWAENISWLMSQCRGEFWYYHQQDDIVALEYVESLVVHARVHQAAAVICCDIELFGNVTGHIHQAPVTGLAAAREIDLCRTIIRPWPSVA